MIEGDTPATPEATAEAEENEKVPLKNYLERYSEATTIPVETLQKALLSHNPFDLHERLRRSISIVTTELILGNKAIIVGSTLKTRKLLGNVYFIKDGKLRDVGFAEDIVDVTGKNGKKIKTKPALAKALVQTCGFDYAYEAGDDLSDMLYTIFAKFANK